MGFLTDNKAIVAFKNLLGKSQTDSSKELGNESEGIFFNVPSDTIFIDVIPSTPNDAVSQGIAVFVEASMTVDSTSNGHALFANWPVTPPTGTDPTTAAPYAYGAGLLTDVTSGDRVRNAISPSFGSLYEAKPYAGANLISVGDQRDWLYQYQSGVFFQQDGSNESWGGSSYGNPTILKLYVYVGQTLADLNNPNLANASDTQILYVSGSEKIIRGDNNFVWDYDSKHMTISGSLTVTGSLYAKIDGGSF